MLYGEELRQLLTEGVLTDLVTAFSREGPEKVYVQDRLLQQGDRLAPLMLHDQACVFVCGCE
jgi:sulfite reductase alpha subunit-like flavoprotein